MANFRQLLNRLASKVKDMSEDHQIPIELLGGTKRNDTLQRHAGRL